ncbi:hypothetical protein SAPIO_CDS6253 [Scedosporium apiospermum]|uniref:Uncharacterized protein n=1 Tax=Pseudallescheria apiosperma TaxID=563466 RepID=A0A084G4C1_PSEDA|nr:uncharacterized protein SAPIO_CDS6253 [Scedosporium apiospermum]KEZ42183.1 hypothetical protein SAPIO_CDS6253 [Scedosporium apiospermum]
MKPFPTTLASVALVGAGAAVAGGKGTVGLCQSMTYADGGIYCRETNVGSCISDLGDFPAKKTWNLEILWTDDGSIHLIKETNQRSVYTKFKDKLYIDASPSAVRPISFTPDNTTLTGGETSWAWSGAYGLILWSPTGNPSDGLAEGGLVTGQGVEWLDVAGYPGLKQAYWNVTKFEESRRTGVNRGGSFAMCYGDYQSVIVEGDRP